MTTPDLSAAAIQKAIERRLNLSARISSIPLSKGEAEALIHILDILTLARKDAREITTALFDAAGVSDDAHQTFTRFETIITAALAARDVETEAQRDAWDDLLKACEKKNRRKILRLEKQLAQAIKDRDYREERR